MSDNICFYLPPFPRIKSYYDMIDIAVQYNHRAIEGLGMFEFKIPDKEAAKKIREYADSKNIKFSCFSVFTDIVGKDSKNKVENLKKYADVARILGSPYLHHTIANEIRNPDNVIPNKYELFKKGIDNVREIYDYAESIGIKTIYEEQGYIYNGIKAFGDFLDKVNRDVGIVADFGNIYQSGDDISEFIKAYYKRIVHVHIKDVVITDTAVSASSLKTLTGKYMNTVQIGKGEVKIDKLINLLKNFGYNGFYSIEFSSKNDNSSEIDECLKLVNSYLSK